MVRGLLERTLQAFLAACLPPFAGFIRTKTGTLASPFASFIRSTGFIRTKTILPSYQSRNILAI